MTDLDSHLLRHFLDARDQSVSGDRLAKELGVSRVAIWNRLERLRGAGFVFSASTRKGYVLKSVPRELYPALIEAHLQRLNFQPKLEFLAEVDSTNSEAERRLAAGQEAPFAVLARLQNAGRGRLGRKWHSRHPGNLYLSLAFRPLITPERLKPFTLWMGLALCAHLDKNLGIRLGLKWPNDLLAPDGRKVAGMLTEARLDADRVRECVFGLGLNVTAQREDFPEELRQLASSLAQVSSANLEINQIAAEILQALWSAWKDYEAGIWIKSFMPYWERYDVLTGKFVKIGLLGEPKEGVVRGINEEGSLILQSPAGLTQVISSGEVTLRKD
jgi:BirA family biotin operon repressor/biotin-[acetyl-CoA-carboxylase] ligase